MYMNVVLYLIEKFYEEEKYFIILLILLSFTLTAIQINGISYITAQIIESAQSGKIGLINNFKWFIAISVTSLILYYIFKRIQVNLMVKMTQWTKHELLKVVLKTNNVNMSNVNFVEFLTPITRIATSFYILFTNFLSSIIPVIAFLFSINGYLFYKNFALGVYFFLGNLSIVLYLYMFWDSMLVSKNKQETISNENEYYLTDVMNNIDKVIYRGQCENELDIFKKKTDDAVDIAQTYITSINDHTFATNIIIYCVIFSICGYLILLKTRNEISTTTFITFFTIMLLYRDRMLTNTSDLADYVEFVGRIQYINNKFNTMIGANKDIKKAFDIEYKPVDLKFDRIRFTDVSFRYEGTENWVLSHFNANIELKKIIGVTGLSGRGKSSFVKLILKLYEPTEGDVFIDDVNVKDIDPNYIRQNVTYVNQNSKLFNKKIIENIMYGCSNTDKCDAHLAEILKFSKVKELFKKVDLQNGLAGNLGENLSGGQRQIVNIISGLVNPTKILVLDEPTNALDKDLKMELLSIIAKFQKYKKAIIVITHDRDMYPLFDKTVQM